MVAIIRNDEWDVDRRLAELGLSRLPLFNVLQVAFAEHGNCTENDPAGSKGLAVYRWGVRSLREHYRSEGWDLDRSGGLETIVNHELKIRIAVINTDGGTCNPNQIPQNRNRKGPNSERAALVNAQMFPDAEKWPRTGADGQPIVTDEYRTWHLCVCIDGDDLRAELSMLNEFASGYFTDCYERIFLVEPGQWDPLADAGSPPDSGSEEPSVEVRRKK